MIHKHQKPILLFALGSIAAVLIAFTPVRVLFDQAMLVMHLEDLGDLAVPLFLVGYAIATVLGIPGTVLTIAGGAVFGLLWGTVWSVIGATVGAIGAFWVARFFLHNWAQRHFGHHRLLSRLQQTIQDHPLRSVLAVRLANIVPFNLANFLFGLTPVDLKTYTLGTFFGIMPGSLLYTWLGVTGMQALKGGDRVPFLLALGGLTLIAVLPLLLKNRSAS